MTRLTTTQKLWGTLGIIWVAMLLLVAGWPGRIARRLRVNAETVFNT